MEFPYLSLTILIGGLIGLGIGTELTINCSVKAAWRFGFSPFLIGLTLVSIGTSIPEMAIGIVGGLDRLTGLETSGIVVGNYVGSVLNQMTIILGISGLLGTLTVSKKTLKKVGSALLASLLFFFIIALDHEISVFEGYLLITIFAGYLACLIFYEKKLERLDISVLEDKMRGFKICKMEQPVHLDIIFLFIGISIVAFGSEAVIQGGLELAEFMNVDQSVIGLFFVGYGTGIPELVVSARAIRKGDISLSIGNLLGSSIVDILLSTGTGSIISGFTVSEKTLWFYIPITILSTILALIFLGTGEKLKSKESLLLISIYLLIAAFSFMM